MARYEIQLVTSDCKNAGSDARFFVTLNGSSGSSAESQIDNKQDNFERDKLDLFHIDTARPIGDIRSVRIRHDNSGSKPGWHGRYMVVREMSSARPFIARIDRWLAVGEGDGKIDVTVDAALHQASETVAHPFDIERFAFKFHNSFPDPLPILNQSWGFCGGMSAAVLHRARANVAAPPDTTVPMKGSPLYQELLTRQLITLSPSVLTRMTKFQVSPNESSRWEPHSIGYHTKENWRDSLRPMLRVSPTITLLILSDKSDSPTQNHQILATGFQYFKDTQDLIITAYDSNSADKRANLFFNLQRSQIKGRFGDGRRVRGFFWNENTDNAAD